MNAHLTTPLQLFDICWKPLNLRLSSPMVTSRQRFTERSVAVLRLDVDIGGQTGWGFGEVAPLAGWTPESMADVDAALRQLKSDQCPSNTFSLADQGLDEVFPALREMPALRFGIELALLDALARHSDCPLRTVLTCPGHRPVDHIELQSTQGIADTDPTVHAARLALDAGYHCIKLKVQDRQRDAEIKRLEAVRRQLPKIDLRLDANGAFDTDGASRFIDRIAPLNIDLFEQPVAASELTDLNAIAQSSTVPIAADESSVPAGQAQRLVEAGHIDALVLKPSAIGGLLPTISIVDAASQRGIRVVLSTLLESAIGRRAIAQLAAAHPDIAGPQGLATGNWFADDLAPAPDLIVGGRLDLSPEPGIGFIPRHHSGRDFEWGGPS